MAGTAGHLGCGTVPTSLKIRPATIIRPANAIGDKYDIVCRADNLPGFGTGDPPVRGTDDLPVRGTDDLSGRGTDNLPVDGTDNLPGRGTDDLPLRGRGTQTWDSFQVLTSPKFVKYKLSEPLSPYNHITQPPNHVTHP